jgi:hypothetical protein
LEVGFIKEKHMALWKRKKCLWSLPTTEEVFDKHGSLGRQMRVLRAARA